MYQCEKCLKCFEELPLEHGDFVGNPITGYKHKKCNGKLKKLRG